MAKYTFYHFLLLIFLTGSVYSQKYSPSTSSFQKFENGGIEVADLDNDMDLDIIMTGLSVSGDAKTIVYKNDNGVFVEVPTNLPNLQNSDVACGDYNNDGLLDIAISGFDLSGNYTTLYTNQGNFDFIESTENSFQGLFNSTLSWIDYDADNDMDFLLTGTNGQMEEFSILYENLDGYSFTTLNSLSMNGLTQASIKWTDIDIDGDLDIAAIGLTANEGENFTGIFINNGDKTFTKSNFVFPQLMNGAIDFGDFDNDLDQDVIITGNSSSNLHFSKLYLNESGNFIEFELTLEGVAQNYRTGTGFIDFDTDGDLDILLSGRAGGINGSSVLKLLENSNLVLNPVSNVGIPEIIAREIYPGDYDNDGDIDILILHDGYSGTEKMLFLNNSSTASYKLNLKPAPPSFFDRFVKGNENILTWNTGDDDLTSIEALTYNFYAGTKTLSDDIVPAHSNLTTGNRKLPNKGNSRLLKTKLNTDYEGFVFWAVQSIDGNCIGSEFSEEQQFYNILAPTTLTGVIENDPLSIHLAWTDNSKVETKYNIRRSYNSQNFQLIFEGTSDMESFHDLSANQIEVLYSYHVSVENSLGESGYDSISVAIPAPPEGFRLDRYNRFEDYINLLWNDVSNYETGFTIERSFMDLNSFSQIHFNDKNTSAFSDSFQPQEGYYYYRSYAFNNFGNGPFSDTVHFINIHPPSNLSGAAISGPLHIQLAWTDNSNIEETYEIYKSVGQEPSKMLISLSANSTEYLDTEILNFETKYQYYVKCSLDDFSSEFDSIALVVPAPPMNLTARDSVGNVFIEWKDQSNFEDEFIIECSEYNTDNFQEISRVPQNNENYLDIRDLNKGEFYYRIKSITEDGTGIYSDTIFFTFLSKPEISGAVITRDSLFIEILWEDLTEYESHYKITKIDRETSISNYQDLPQNSENYKDISVALEKEYIYLLQAFNEFALSTADSILVAIPQSPELLTPLILENKIILKWVDKSAFEEKYIIERANNNPNFEILDEVDANTEIFEDIEVVDGSTYQYRVIPANVYGQGYTSDTISITYLDAPLESGSEIDSENRTIVITWQDISTHEDGYIIERKFINESDYVVIDTIPADSEFYLDEQISNSGTYSYRISAYNNHGRSETIVMSVNLITSLYGEILEGINLYPNPASSIVQIDIPKEINKNPSILLYTISGEMIKRDHYDVYHTKSGISLDVKNLTRGLYMISIEIDEINHIYKLIKE